MKASQKIAVSILIATVLFGAFSLLAFSGLFPMIEAQFFSPRIIVSIQDNLKNLQAAEKNYLKRVDDGLKLLVAEPFIKNALNPVQSREDIASQANSLRLFLRGIQGKAEFRLTDPNLTRISLSSSEDDQGERRGSFIVFKDYQSNDYWPEKDDLLKVLPTGGAFLDTSRNLRILTVPLKDKPGGGISGYGLLSLPFEDLYFDLFQQGLVTDRRFVRQVSPELRLVGFSDVITKQLLEQIASPSGFRTTEGSVRYLTEAGTRFVAVRGAGEAASWYAVLPASMLELGDLLKGIILFTVFSLIFLPAFIALNIRPEPEIVWKRRLKLVQIQVLSEFFEETKKPGIDPGRHLAMNSGQIKEQLRAAIGKVGKKQSPLVEELLETSWDNILSVMGVQGPAPPSAASPSDIDRIEALLKEALSRGPVSVSKPSPQQAPVKVTAEQSSAEVEDLQELEEVEELEEAEELEVLEELDDAEDLHQVRKTEVTQEPEEAEELEELEELQEEFEPAEELPEETSGAVAAEVEIEELTGVDEDPAVDELEADEGLEDLEEIEELKELDELEEQSASGLPLEPVASGPDLFLYQGKLTQDARELEELKTMGDGELLPVEDIDEAAGEDRYVKVFTLEEISNYYQTRSPMEESGGVYTIRHEVFKAGGTEVKNGEFTALVNSVMKSEAGPQAFLLESEGLQDIRKVWTWTPGGFDFDQLLEGYREGEIGLYKALVDLSSIFGAVGAALVCGTSQGWATQHSVGFTDAGKKKLNFPTEGQIGKSYLCNGGLYILDLRYIDSSFRPHLTEKDLKFINAAVFIPVIYQGKPSYLLLGVRSYPTKILEVLSPRGNV